MGMSKLTKETKVTSPGGKVVNSAVQRRFIAYKWHGVSLIIVRWWEQREGNQWDVQHVEKFETRKYSERGSLVNRFSNIYIFSHHLLRDYSRLLFSSIPPTATRRWANTTVTKYH
jgi:hypothetical protein